MLEKIKSFLFENKTEKQIIAKNTFWLTFGMIVSRSLRAIMIMYAARVLGTEGYGAFSYALSFAGLFGVFSDMGLSGILTRQIVQEPEREKTYISTTFFLKLIALVVTVSITIFVGPYLTNVAGIKELLFAISVLLAFDSLRNFAFSIARSKNKMQVESGGGIITDGLITLLGVVALIIFPSAKFLAYGYTAGVIIGTIITFFILRKDFIGVFSHFNPSIARTLIVSSWPFALMGLFGGLMINIDTLIIGWFRTAHDLGLYGAAQRPILLLYVLPGLFSVSMFPIISKYFAEKNMEAIRIRVEKAIAITMLGALPFLAGGIVVGVPLTVFLFSDAFIGAALPLQILLLTLPLVFAGTIMGNAIFACHKQKVFIVAYGSGAVANIILDLLLIPKYGVVGSAFATLVSQAFSNGWLWIYTRKMIHFKLFAPAKKIAIASLGMAIVCLVFSLFSPHVLVTIMVGGITYVSLLFILKEPLVEGLLN
ncbi:flippase [Candidatus Parcubacteria bacterium]|jgi:O-antigen/teichoic acid export membrane protein|nr:MAG: flippase [Candidatus Parcubacteria bacterium]